MDTHEGIIDTIRPLYDPISFSTTIIDMFSCGTNTRETHLGTATGFFYTTKSKLWLITNHHVVVNYQNKFYPDKLVIKMHTDLNSLKENREIEIPLYEENNEIWYNFKIDDEILDVIAIDITELINFEQDFFWAFSKENLVPILREVSVGEDVLIVGYPVGFYDFKNNLPIVKSGTIASTYNILFDDKFQFLIDANLQPGTSGSPVLIRHKILTISDRENLDSLLSYRLAGIYSGEYTPDGIYAGLNIVWYSAILEYILSEYDR